MWIKFKHQSRDAYGNFTTVKFAIEVKKLDNALAICNIFNNNPKVKDTEININRPVDMYTIYINKEGNTESRSDHLVTNADIQSFIWAIKAGISMGKALMEK